MTQSWLLLFLLFFISIKPPTMLSTIPQPPRGAAATTRMSFTFNFKRLIILPVDSFVDSQITRGSSGHCSPVVKQSHRMKKESSKSIAKRNVDNENNFWSLFPCWHNRPLSGGFFCWFSDNIVYKWIQHECKIVVCSYDLFVLFELSRWHRHKKSS